MFSQRSNRQQFQQWLNSLNPLVCLVLLIIATPALAHHPLDGRLPANFFEGIMSGFGHPIIGFDHLAFVIASGLLAAKMGRGILIPIAFTIATALGAIIHLQAIDLPIPEIVIAASVVLFGVLLITGKQQNQSPNYQAMLVGLAALAGIFHGHAYGEGIFGAETTPLMAYLLGFTIIQIAISLGVYALATQVMKTASIKTMTRFAGLAITAIGMVFLTSAITG